MAKKVKVYAEIFAPSSCLACPLAKYLPMSAMHYCSIGEKEHVTPFKTVPSPSCPLKTKEEIINGTLSL